jgi:malonate transporter and related proteins
VSARRSGSIFSNNVLLGIPLAKIILGDGSLPSVSLVVVFNSLVLWTLVTVSVEWTRNRDLTLRGFANTALGVVLNPVVGSILLGIAFSFTGLAMPTVVTDTLGLLSQAAVPMSLIVLGMGLAEYASEGTVPFESPAAVKRDCP